MKLRKGGDIIAEQQKPKRKTHTSTEVTQRYQKKTYQQFITRFRKVEDADCIEYIEAEKEKGYTPTEIFKRLIRKNG